MAVYNMGGHHHYNNGNNGRLGMRTETKELQYPLPPEGQPVPKTDASIGFFGGGSGDGGDDEDDEDDEDEG